MDAILFTYGKKFLTNFLAFSKVLAEYENFKSTVGGVAVPDVGTIPMDGEQHE